VNVKARSIEASPTLRTDSVLILSIGTAESIAVLGLERLPVTRTSSSASPSLRI
jgi:hypothetical protein